jgi:hypothetical protein
VWLLKLKGSGVALISVNNNAVIQRYSVCIRENNTDFSKQVYEQFEEQIQIARKFVRKRIMSVNISQ